ncbi:RNA polymerase sigma-70 factor [Bacteroides congonensis]|uniref:RNA polymerase sigma-70 factor n=1 Tax=Bacteroides congonensis TaxID=1871006 RepID=UPI0018971137|nr:RNA polymerase sigma-70 factor [Bacteroides congonensis]
MNIYKGNIIADIKRGNKNAFKKLFDDYFPILCVFSFHYVEDKEVCKDIVQESFLSYWERKENFDDLLKVKSFLYTVTRNKCLNHLKHEQLDISHLVEQEDTDSDHETIIIEQETYRLVRKAVEELPSQMKKVILYSMQGLKKHEIADKMKISEGTVHTLKKIAYRKLRDKLKDINYILLLFLCK